MMNVSWLVSLQALGYTEMTAVQLCGTSSSGYLTQAWHKSQSTEEEDRLSLLLVECATLHSSWCGQSCYVNSSKHVLKETH